MEELLKRIIELFINAEESGVVSSLNQLQKIKESKEFADFVVGTRSLQKVPPVLIRSNLWKVSVDGKPHEEKIAFWLNCYNLLALHGLIVFGGIASPKDLFFFSQKASYIIGGCTYSLLDIEYSVLRDKTKGDRFSN